MADYILGGLLLLLFILAENLAVAAPVAVRAVPTPRLVVRNKCFA